MVTDDADEVPIGMEITKMTATAIMMRAVHLILVLVDDGLLLLLLLLLLPPLAPSTEKWAWVAKVQRQSLGCFPQVRWSSPHRYRRRRYCCHHNSYCDESVYCQHCELGSLHCAYYCCCCCCHRRRNHRDVVFVVSDVAAVGAAEDPSIDYRPCSFRLLSLILLLRRVLLLLPARRRRRRTSRCQLLCPREAFQCAANRE